jgi:hypothetical protein
MPRPILGMSNLKKAFPYRRRENRSKTRFGSKGFTPDFKNRQPNIL